MKTITVTNKKDWSSETVGNYDDCGDYTLVSTGYQTQVAKLFHTNHEYSLLSSVNICHKFLLFTTEKSIFRIRIYEQDSISGQSSTELYDEPIEVIQKNKFTKLNLEQYQIWLPHKTFFIAIEWLKIPYNEADKSKEKKANRLPIYNPRIGASNVTSGKGETWMLTYRNIWIPMKHQDISMSANVKY